MATVVRFLPMSSHLYDNTYVRQIRHILYLIRISERQTEYRTSCVLSLYQQFYMMIIVDDNNADDRNAIRMASTHRSRLVYNYRSILL